MSLVIGLKVADRVLIAGDSIALSGPTYQPDEPKVERRGDYVVGMTGSSTTYHAFCHEADDAKDWFHPGYLRGIVLDLARTLNALKAEGLRDGDSAEVQMALLIARGRRHLFVLNEEGQLWPAGPYQAIGQGDQVATYLLRKGYREDMTVDEAVALAQTVIAEVATVTPFVKLPVTWMVTE